MTAEEVCRERSEVELTHRLLLILARRRINPAAMRNHPVNRVLKPHLWGDQIEAGRLIARRWLYELKGLDVNSLSPIEALNKLYEWQKKYVGKKD